MEYMNFFESCREIELDNTMLGEISDIYTDRVEFWALPDDERITVFFSNIVRIDLTSFSTHNRAIVETE